MYLLRNDVVWMKDMFRYISEAGNVKKVRTTLPMPLTRIMVKFCVLLGKITKSKTIYDEVRWLENEGLGYLTADILSDGGCDFVIKFSILGFFCIILIE